MGRAHLDYGVRSTAPHTFVGFDADTSVAGYYRTRLRSGAVAVGVRIWFGPPHDPDTGEEMDRSHRWQAEAGGAFVELEAVWPKCAGEPIDEHEFRHLTDLAAWASDHAPETLSPTRRVDPLTSPLMF